MAEADCLIIACPVYALNVPATLKNLFDHTAYLYHRPAMFSKKALVLTSTAGAGAQSSARYIRDTLKHWGFNRVYTVPVRRGGEEALTENVRRKCARAARAFARDARSGRLRAPTLKRLLLFGAWRAMAARGFVARDRAYWQETGLSAHAFAPGAPLGFVKRGLGRLFYRLFYRAV